MQKKEKEERKITIENIDKLEKVVGIKQVLKNIQANKLDVIYLAHDADDDFKKNIHECAVRNDVDVVMAGTIEHLGVLCGIDVGAAVIGIIK